MNILITGATSGIGKQLALDYHDLGHKVFAVGRNREQLEKLADMGLETAQLDLYDQQKTLEWFQKQETIDLAILNAGTCEYIDLPDFDSALVARVMNANVNTFATCVEGVLPLLRRSSNPHLVGVSSSVTYVPLPRAEAYGASKAAISYLCNTLRIDLYNEGIPVTVVNPGFVKTPLTDKNDFPMPMRISVEEASKIIRKGIASRKPEISFPWRFTSILRLFSLLPIRLWTRIAQRMIEHEK